jgi:hypothetical protein
MLGHCSGDTAAAQGRHGLEVCRVRCRRSFDRTPERLFCTFGTTCAAQARVTLVTTSVARFKYFWGFVAPRLLSG